MFVPGIFVEEMFYVTPIPWFDLAISRLQLMSIIRNTLTSGSGVCAFVPSSAGLTPAQKAAEALAHWLPPYEMLSDALSGISTADIPSQFIVSGQVVLSQDAAVDFAEIVRNNFTTDGSVMSAAVANLIYTRIQSAIQTLADDFFIAGRDYNEDYSNPAKAAYIASFFAREDQILIDDDPNWEKLYSATEGLGRINRNLEGIPTATFWELDFSGDTRSVVPYTLDDGKPIFLRGPDEWWANYTVTALGNDRTDADIKKLQYVGNVHTYDEVVGQVRDVAQLKYTQEWSYMQAVGEPAGPHTPGDTWTTLDYDDSPARWVVTYQETPDPNWPVGELTSYEQYSIRDGREYNS